VPAYQFIEFPFDRRVFFAHLLILVSRRSFFGRQVLCLKIVFADLARVALVRLEALAPARAGRALAGFEIVNPAVIFRLAVAGFRRGSVRAPQFVTRFIEFEILRLIQIGRLRPIGLGRHLDRQLWAVGIIAQGFEYRAVVADRVN